MERDPKAGPSKSEKKEVDMVTYQALFEPAEEGGFVITFPDLGYGATQGEDEEDSIKEAALKQGKPLPVAKSHRGKKYRSIYVPALSGEKAELYREFLASGVRKSELAKRIGISKAAIYRLFDFRHSSRLELLDAAFAALGKRLVIGVDVAA